MIAFSKMGAVRVCIQRHSLPTKPAPELIQQPHLLEYLSLIRPLLTSTLALTHAAL